MNSTALVLPVSSRELIEVGLAECERYMQLSWQLRGLALDAIREGRLYREAGYERFDRYCRDEWDLEVKQAYNSMYASRVARVIPEVKRESQALALWPVLNDNDHGPEGVLAIWEAARSNGKVTAATLKQLVDQRLGRALPPPRSETVDVSAKPVKPVVTRDPPSPRGETVDVAARTVGPPPDTRRFTVIIKSSLAKQVTELCDRLNVNLNVFTEAAWRMALARPAALRRG